MQLEIAEIDVLDQIPVVRLRGDIDMSNIAVIEEKIVAGVTNEASSLILDLSDVTYLDSAGIRLLYQLDSRLAGRKRKLFVVIPEESHINRTLEAAGGRDSFANVGTVVEAVARVRAARPDR